MPKFPRDGWTHHKDGPKMRSTTIGDKVQDFYFPPTHPTMPGWFKGMEIIIRERGLWPETGLLAQCEGFRCLPGAKSCCCRRVLYCQPDFCSQTSHLAEYVQSRGHICDFYPKFHCELNFIEQYWGAAKLNYRTSPKTSSVDEMEANVIRCLDDVPLVQIQRYAFTVLFPLILMTRRYANRSARFIHAYSEGLTGAEAAWANRKYHGHRTLPPAILAKVRAAFKDK